MNKFKTFYDKMTTWLKKYLGLALMCIGIIWSIFMLGWVIYDYAKEKEIREHDFSIMQGSAELNYYTYKNHLIAEVNTYINSVAPASLLNGYSVVECCEKYDMDIRFVLAQGHLESKFGTCGVAKKTNSVFNVGAYDGVGYEKINGKYKYRHPDFSIEPYIRLLYQDYIADNATELDLMHKFVSKNGKRYSSNKDYENILFGIFERIDKETKINELQGLMRKYKIISGH